MDGNSETVLHQRLVPSQTQYGYIPVRVALGRDSAGATFFCINLSFAAGDGLYFVHTASIPYSPPSQDSRLFGAIVIPQTALDARQGDFSAYERFMASLQTLPQGGAYDLYAYEFYAAWFNRVHAVFAGTDKIGRAHV